MKQTMITDINQLDFKKRYTYADYLTWKFTERVELIKGWLYQMSPAPRRRHQKISGELFFLLKSNSLLEGCEIYDAPFDVRLVKNERAQHRTIDTVVQPDICVICDPGKLDEMGCQGAPDLIVEITSPATAKKDYNEKFRLYEENEVLEYWIVNPEAQSLEIFGFVDGHYQSLTLNERKYNPVAESRLFNGLAIDLRKVITE